MASGKGGYKHKGKFFQIPNSVLDSPAYRDLKPPARALIFEFGRDYTPQKNGRLFISTRQAVERLKVSEPVALRAFYELASHGFIKLTGHENWMERKARYWALTFKAINNRLQDKILSTAIDSSY